MPRQPGKTQPSSSEEAQGRLTSTIAEEQHFSDPPALSPQPLPPHLPHPPAQQAAPLRIPPLQKPCEVGAALDFVGSRVDGVGALLGVFDGVPVGSFVGG